MRLLVTSCGAPNGEAIFRDIRNEEREHPTFISSWDVLIGCDSDPWAAGRLFCDEFHEVARYREDTEQYWSDIAGIKADYILPLNGYEAAILNADFDNVLSSDTEIIATCLDKAHLYDELGIDHVVCGVDELFRYVDVGKVVKPRNGRGSRGVFLIDRVDDWALRLEEKPGSLCISPWFLLDMIKGKRALPHVEDFVVMPRYEGREVFVNCLCDGGKIVWWQMLEVLRKINHVASLCKVIEDEALLQQCASITNHFGFDYWVNLQFIGGNLIEVNPRISTFCPHPDYSVPFLAVRLARGEDIHEYPLVKEGSVVQRFFESRSV